MQWLILLSLCFATFSANSKVQEHPIEHLLNIEIAAYQLSSAFSAYVLFEGSPKFSKKLESTLEETRTMLTNENANYPEIVKKWQGSLNFIERNKSLVFDGSNHRLIAGLATTHNNLYKLINNKQQSVAQLNPKTPALSPAHNEYLNTRVSFERVIAQYMAYSGSALGFIHSDRSIEENVDTFSSHIKQIKNKNADFKRLNSKWDFIKGSLAKGSSQSVPFITLHTAADIRKTLQRIYKG